MEITSESLDPHRVFQHPPLKAPIQSKLSWRWQAQVEPMR
jgi:hypothetical protein